MYSFKNDYSEIAHKDIIAIIQDNYNNQFNGYGLDKISEEAKLLIKKHIDKDVDIHFLIGGTSTNKIAISHMLKPYEAVICVESGHINVHETGAIENSGHKVITVKGKDGKITVDEIISVYNQHTDEHMVKPKLVYISNATEIGTIYTLKELKDIYNITRKLCLNLYIDGARIGTALTSSKCDITLNDLAKYSDMFYIGGTKNGAMLGEALVVVNDNFKENVRYSIKQNGGMLAKGFLIGLQFKALFTNDLFFRLALHANTLAQKLKEELLEMNVKMPYDSPTNQQFITLSRSHVERLRKNYQFEIWEDKGEELTIRLVTSWATPIEAVNKFIEDLKNIVNDKK